MANYTTMKKERGTTQPPASKFDSPFNVPKLGFVSIDNFGDALNPWIWKALIPRLEMSGDIRPSPASLEGVTLFSIGSYLAEGVLGQFTDSRRCAIAGAGCGYGLSSMGFSLLSPFPYYQNSHLRLDVSHLRKQLSPSVRVYWVRGPLTAHLLGLDRAAAIADGAYLIRLTGQAPIVSHRKGVAFMPHLSTALLATFQPACERLGITYIDPRWERNRILKLVASSELLITEALHGAIVSDALRTPWIPVRSSENILRFKWLDFCRSINVDYRPSVLAGRWHGKALAQMQRRRMKKFLFSARARLHNLTTHERRVDHSLLDALGARPFLSSDSMIKSIDQRLMEQVERLVSDMDSDPFFHPGKRPAFAPG
jgi:succinoglycan biosynthesis protein ExoV